jgi:hypothetical protein
MFANPDYPQRIEKKISWPPICMGCGDPNQEDLQLFKFLVQKKNLIENRNTYTYTYTVYEMIVSAFLCESCYLRDRKSHNLEIGVTYPLILGVVFLPLNILLANFRSSMASLIGLIVTIIFYGVYYLIAVLYLKENYVPAKSLLEVRIDKYDISFKFTSPKYAATFGYYNPGLNVIYKK